jgi:type VI secretion system secreted protein VgrG
MAAEPMTPANVADFRFRTAGFETDDLRVTAFAGTEGVSELFNYRIRLCSENDNIDPRPLLGQAATLEIDGEHGTRLIHGILRSFGRVGEGTKLVHYEAQLVPPHWLLTRRIQSRVFNEKRCKRMDVVGVVSKVLADAGFQTEDLRVAIARQYEPREFVVQYRESDWDFIARRLEEEGIYYFFEHGPQRCRLVLMDAKGLHSPFVSEGADVPFRTSTGLVEDHEYVFSAQMAGQMHIGAVSLDDFNFRQPGQELRLGVGGARFTNLSLTDYPGGYRDTGRGKRLVETRLEEKLCEEQRLTLGSTVRGFWPGGRFTLTEHPDKRFNTEYLILSMAERATQSQSAEEEAGDDDGSRFETEVRVIPASTQFRPPRCTPCPTVLGSQTAIVVGPPGEEIYTDEYGRVEVRFHWDQEGGFEPGASCWIRVSQGWAGGQYGMLFLPRVGQEVIVDFLEGDPDQPIITGRVYNRDHMPPYKLPDQRTISTIRTCSSPGAGGGNEIRFEDKKGGEQLLLFAQNALHLRAGGSRFESVCGSAHRTVGGDSHENVKKSKHSIVNLDVRERVDGSYYQDVRGDVLNGVAGSYMAWVQNGYLLQCKNHVLVDADGSVTLYCKGNFITVDEQGVTIVGKVVNINSGGTAPVGTMGEPKLAEDAAPAATTQFGHNVNYTKSGPESDPKATGDGAVDDKKQQQQTSWIEIELIDEQGQPVAGEAFEVLLPDGKKIAGTLDRFGQAHVAVPDPGLCQITFPRLDAAAWEPLA